MTPDVRLVPSHTLAGLEAYVNHGVPPGDFLHAVLTNNLVETCAKADDLNLAAIPHIAAWLWNCAPIPCWGSAEKVAAWLREKRKEDD